MQCRRRLGGDGSNIDEKIWRCGGVEMEMEISDMGMKKQTRIKVTVEQRQCHIAEMETGRQRDR
jgi:hypothetical protein